MQLADLPSSLVGELMGRGASVPSLASSSLQQVRLLSKSIDISIGSRLRLVSSVVLVCTAIHTHAHTHTPLPPPPVGFPAATCCAPCVPLRTMCAHAPSPPQHLHRDVLCAAIKTENNGSSDESSSSDCDERHKPGDRRTGMPTVSSTEPADSTVYDCRGEWITRTEVKGSSC